MAKLLAILVADRERFSYIDRIANAPSIDSVLWYLREALRDFYSLKRMLRKMVAKGPTEEKLWKWMNEIDDNKVNIFLEKLSGIEDRIELRKTVSLLCGKALALADRFMSELEKGE